jgi:hypothetical protein
MFVWKGDVRTIEMLSHKYIILMPSTNFPQFFSFITTQPEFHLLIIINVLQQCDTWCVILPVNQSHRELCTFLHIYVLEHVEKYITIHQLCAINIEHVHLDRTGKHSYI